MSAPTRRRSSALVVLGVATVMAASMALSPSTPASATWSAQSTGSATGAATVMPTGSTPTAVVSGTSVQVTWSAATLDGTGVAGYVVNRYDATTDALASIGAGCSGTVTTTSCTESSVPAGNWTYTVTPVQANWTGSESSPSTAVTVP